MNDPNTKMAPYFCHDSASSATAPFLESLVKTMPPQEAAAEAAPIETNVCDVNYYYCPRDPGCTTYTMSVHSINVRANDYTGNVAMEDLKSGDSITVQASGVTTIEEVPTSGSWRIYGLDGKNVAAGILTNTLEINYNKTSLQYDFVMTVGFKLGADNFDTTKNFTEWTLDVFQQKSGTDEGMCVEFGDASYVEYMQSKPDPPFVDLCIDNGDGTFAKDTVAISASHHTLHSTATNPECSAPAPKTPCDLKWNWCPRDPGCKTYTMDVASVETDIKSADSVVEAGDVFTVTVRGTTSMTTVPVAGSYRIYALSGGNAATGVLTDVLTIDRGTFVMKIPFTATADCFVTAKGWFEFGIDVFQAKSGTDEGMCIEIANPAYIQYEDTVPGHPFVTDCDMTSFPFKEIAGGVPEVVHPVTCKFV
jgi:hypothetical protein